MKKFRFKYAPAVWVLLILVLLLSVGGLLWNIFNLVEFYSLNHTFKLISYALIVIVCLFLTAFVLSVIFLWELPYKRRYALHLFWIF